MSNSGYRLVRVVRSSTSTTVTRCIWVNCNSTTCTFCDNCLLSVMRRDYPGWEVSISRVSAPEGCRYQNAESNFVEWMKC